MSHQSCQLETPGAEIFRKSAPTASLTDLKPSLAKHSASSRLTLGTNAGPAYARPV